MPGIANLIPANPLSIHVISMSKLPSTYFPAEFTTVLEGIDVVSFDVFDTLLLRRHFVPTDVFMEPAIGEPERPHFRLLRIAAERLARLQHHRREDVTLDEIYRWLPQDVRTELDAEARTLYANPAAMDLYREATA